MSRPREPVEVLGAALFDLLSGKPINREQTLGAAQDLFSQWRGMAAGYHPDVGPPPPSGTRWTPRPPGGAPRQPPVDTGHLRQARETLGFGNEPLTDEMISRRRRELARRYHPDRVGNATKKVRMGEQMAAVNAAADLLSMSTENMRPL